MSADGSGGVVNRSEPEVQRDPQERITWNEVAGTWLLGDLRLLGLMGDVHGDLAHILRAVEMFHRRGVRVMVQLGDFGMIWPRWNWSADLGTLDRFLEDQDQTLLFVDGNHEDFATLEALPVSLDGIRWVGDRIGHLPRGYRAIFPGGRRLAVLGGANSVDRDRRTPRRDWWEREQITVADLRALGDEPADILFSHDAPLGVPGLDRHLASIRTRLSRQGVRYAERGRRMFHQGFLQVRPRLTVGGHYHWHIDERVSFASEAGAFTTRVVVLDAHGTSRGNCAILDVQDLSLEVIDVEGRPYFLDYLGVHR